MTARLSPAQRRVLEALVAGATLWHVGYPYNHSWLDWPNRVTHLRTPTVEALERHGWVKQLKGERRGVGPANEQYTITDAGRAALTPEEPTE